MVSSDDEVKLAVAPCGSSEKNCWGWEGVPIFRSVCADRPLPHGATRKLHLKKYMLKSNYVSMC